MIKVNFRRFVSLAFASLRPAVRGRRALRPFTVVEALENRQLLAVTASAAKMVRDINPSGDSTPTELTNLNGALVFRANGNQLWRSDGTSAGTTVLQSFPAAATDSPSVLSVGNGTLYFRGNDGSTGAELWKSDGTSAGTVLVRDIYAGSSSSQPGLVAAVGSGKVVFSARDVSYGREMWVSDGTSAGTTVLKDLNGGDSWPRNPVLVGGVAFFNANSNTPSQILYELWKTDGTAAGTVLVKDIAPGTGDSDPQYLTNVSGTLFFMARNAVNNFELWKSDGTSAGTVMVRDIRPSGESRPTNLINVGGTLYFTADDGTNGRELWKSDGTSDGTVLVNNINPSGSSNPGSLTVVGSTLYFTADNGSNGVELWKSDGTSAGTVLVKDIRTSGTSSPAKLTNVDGLLYFTADDGVNGVELWRSDGTSAGTVLFLNIHPTGSSSPEQLTNLNGDLFFTATDGTNGRELWVTGMNNAPTDIALSATSIAENQPSGSVVGNLTTTDPDVGNTFTYTLVSTSTYPDNNSFTIGGTSGSSLLTAASFNFEAKSSYTIRVRSTDQWGLSFEKDLTITVINVNSAPTNLSLSATAIAENLPSGTTVGSFSTTDPDAGNTFTYTLVSGTGSTDNGSFTIDGGTLKTAASFDFENQRSYSILVRTTDQGGLSFEKHVTITVNNVNETPTNITLSATAIAENEAIGTAVGSLSTTDPDAANTFTYTLVSATGSTDNGSFTIDGGTLKTNAVFDFETKNNYAIRLRTTDQGGLFFEKEFTITVTDGNDVPTAVSLSNVVSVLLTGANTSSAIRLADVVVTDDGLGTNTLGVSGADASVFEIVAGQLRLKAGTVLNYATQKSYSVTVN
ncbi:MAG: ELWxxDGT repeat protein, partial [Planctomycetaceae bacterium]